MCPEKTTHPLLSGSPRSSSCRIVLAVTGIAAGEALFQVASEVGAGQTVDEEIDAVVAEEDGTRDVDPAACRVRLRRVVRQLLEQLRLADGRTLQEVDVVGTPGHEERDVEDNERGGNRLELPEEHHEKITLHELTG